MDYIVTVNHNNDKNYYTVHEGANLLIFLQEKGFQIESPCGGNGTCGKCRVKVSGIAYSPKKDERVLLGDKLIQKGYILACNYNINSDIEVYFNGNNSEAIIMSEGKSREVNLEPIVIKKYLELKTPELNDQTPDLERVMNGVGPGRCNNLALIGELPDLLRRCDYKVTALMCEEQLIAVEAGNTARCNYGMAVDLGTTTLAAYLMDLNSGKRIDVYSELNPQRKYGADVLSRIDYAMTSSENSNKMQSDIVSCINDIVKYFTEKNGIGIQDIYEAVFVGNTTMMHFLMGIYAGNIAKSPFVSVTTSLHCFNACELGLEMNKNAKALIFPGVSGYVGADTVAAVLSSGMYDKNEVSLMIDIGTNGEVVLGCKDWLLSCSTAAGPAFEGANIRNGIGGIIGAIDKIHLIPEIKYSVIGNVKPIGICGSGILDAVAQMLLASVIDETGRFADDDEKEKLSESLGRRLTIINGQKAFVLVSAEESGCDYDITITQKDIRELQNAKAAIAAGINTLVKRAGKELEDIEKVYLAGGFGNYIDVESAIVIGLLPKVLADRIDSVGNAAGEGAVEGLLSREMLRTSEDISKRIRYIELSADADFTNEYVECMLF